MVDILMTTFNGEAYIIEQIESILRQTHTDWTLYIKDDGSSDNTVDIISKYEAEHKGRIKIVKGALEGSAMRSFFGMLRFSKSEYVMFCDQDDVWLPSKIEKSLDKMKKLERANLPVLIHTDLTVTNENLKILCDSFVAFENLDPRKNGFNRLLTQNIVSGCTVMVNRALLDKIHILPKNALMHDWWLALVAAAFGRIGFLEEPTVLYRQHGNNAVGAKDAKTGAYIFSMAKDYKGIKASLLRTYVQAAEFIDIYGSELDSNLFEMALDYSAMQDFHKLMKIHILMKHKMLKHGFFKKLGQLIYV